MLQRVLESQYEKCFTMLTEAITNYDEILWFDDQHYKSPAWQVVYHALFYTNLYCSATEAGVQRWPNEREHYHDFERMHELRALDRSRVEPYPKEEMAAYLEFIKGKVPEYLAEMKPEERCWPYWYNESQLEFHLNNLRHLQHHTAEIIERHDIAGEFRYAWK